MCHGFWGLEGGGQRCIALYVRIALLFVSDIQTHLSVLIKRAEDLAHSEILPLSVCRFCNTPPECKLVHPHQNAGFATLLDVCINT